MFGIGCCAARSKILRSKRQEVAEAEEIELQSNARERRKLQELRFCESKIRDFGRGSDSHQSGKAEQTARIAVLRSKIREKQVKAKLESVANQENYGFAKQNPRL